MSVQRVWSLYSHSESVVGIKIQKIKETNGFNRGNKLNTSTQSTRIDRIFFDSREDACRVTDQREGVCRQR